MKKQRIVSNNTVQKIERNFGIDALRILAMLMIVVLHILGYGGVLSGTVQYSLSWQVAWFLDIVALCAVNCYALISGFVGFKTKYKYTNLVLIWVRTFFYAILITVCFAVFTRDIVSGQTWKYAVFPVMFKEYWYVTAYVGLFVVMPILNIAIRKLGKRQLGAIVLISVLAFSILPTLFRRDPFALGNGFTAGWLIILYMIGGYIGKYGMELKIKNRYIAVIFLITSIVALAIKNALVLLGKDQFNKYMYSYTSPVVLLLAVLLLIFFARMGISKKVQKIIAFFAPLAFSVYLIHTHPLWHDNITARHFTFLADLPMPLMIIGVLLCAIGIYLLCSVIDLGREFVFRRVRLKERIYGVEKKLIGSDFWKDEIG